MNYEPKTDEQLAKEALLPEGTYDFEIIDTNDKPSKKGNDMITVKMVVFGGDGSHHYLYDYIALGTNFGERKLRRAAAGCGLLGIYMSGELIDRTFMGATGKVLIKQQDGTAEYPIPKNVVADYVPRDDDESTQDKRPSREIIDDDLPF